MLTTNKDISALMKEVGAWQGGHFLLASGLHSNQYLQCQKLLQYPRYGKICADVLAKKILAEKLEVSTVVGPALGAIHWELLVAASLDVYEEDPVKAVFAERPTGSDKFEIRRGVEFKPGERVIVVEDVVTTGGSVKKVIELVKSLGAVPVAVGTIVDRSETDPEFGVPLISLLKLKLPTFKAIECPLCSENVPITKPGSTVKP